MVQVSVIYSDENKHIELYKTLYDKDEEIDFIEDDLDTLLTVEEGDCSTENFNFSFE